MNWRAMHIEHHVKWPMQMPTHNGRSRYNGQPLVKYAFDYLCADVCTAEEMAGGSDDDDVDVDNNDDDDEKICRYFIIMPKCMCILKAFYGFFYVCSIGSMCDSSQVNMCVFAVSRPSLNKIAWNIKMPILSIMWINGHAAFNVDLVWFAHTSSWNYIYGAEKKISLFFFLYFGP